MDTEDPLNYDYKICCYKQIIDVTYGGDFGKIIGYIWINFNENNLNNIYKKSIK